MRLLLLLLTLGLCSPLYADTAGSPLPEIGDRSQRVIDAARESAIGAEFYRQLRRRRRLLDDLPTLRYLDSLGSRLVAASDTPSQRFHFFLVRDRSINAFAVPGGYIGIHLGLFEAAESESELAAVLAHEIAHVTQHHLARAYDKADRMSIPALAAVLAAVLVGTQNSEAGQAILMGTQAGAIQQQINYTRSNEAEADHLGMQILLHAGFDPRGMPRFFDRLQRQARLYGSGPPPLLRTHPVTTERIADALARIPDAQTTDMHRDSLRFHLIRARLKALHGLPEHSGPDSFAATGSESGHRAVARRYGLALAYGERKRYRRAIPILHELYREHPEQTLFVFDLARLQRLAGRLKEARKTIEAGLRLLPGNALLVLESARLELGAGRPMIAVEQLTEPLDSDATRMEFELRQAFLETLARAWRVAGNRARAHETLARREEEAGEISTAIAQLERALEQARDDDARARIQARLHRLRRQQQASGHAH